MITLFTGTPGAGKTAALVDVLKGLIGHRPIYVLGFMEGGKLVASLEGLTIDHTVILAEDWPAELPDGAIAVLDEAQQLWRPRGPGAKPPLHVTELETHRHRGLDFLLTTQGPNLIDGNVRALVGRHVHIRDVGWYGRWWYEWPECNGSLSWRTCQNKRRYRLPKHVFELYKSASLHVKPFRGIPPMLYVAGGLLLLLAFLAFKVTVFLKSVTGGEKRPATPGQVVAGAPPAGTASAARRGARTADILDFAPRIPGQPLTAPAYDHLRVVQRMPTITGAVCVNYSCTCWHGNERLYDIDATQCLRWAYKRPFNPYVPDAGTPEDRRPQAAQQPAPPLNAASALGLGHAATPQSALSNPL